MPAGYADGVPRNLGLAGGEVLRRAGASRSSGIVTMDQLLVDVGDAPADVGDEVVLIGRQGDDEVTAAEWADAARHHLVRDRHRHRRARAAQINGWVHVMEMQWRRGRMARTSGRNRPV